MQEEFLRNAIQYIISLKFSVKCRAKEMVLDRFNRPLTGIRISITQRCNLNCIYCHHEGERGKIQQEMSVDEIIQILKLSTKFGIYKVKYTGGEPLLREDLPEIIKKSKEISAIKEVSIVSNGILLEKFAKKLCEAKLDRINVSLDTLNPNKYAQITNHDGTLIEQVKKGILCALDCGITPLKLNMVLLKGINEAEVTDLITFATEHNLILQLIELVPAHNFHFFKKYHVNLDKIEEYLKTKAENIKIRDDQNRIKYYLINGAEVELVKPFHNSRFCANCHRIRITSNGMIKPCLMRNDNLVDLITPLRNGASDEVLSQIFQKAIDLREPFCK